VLNAAGVSSKEGDSSRDFFSARGFAIDNYQIDGVPMEWSSGGDAGETQSDATLYERVEVVRGATGLLTGAGNPSASINLVRKHADSKELTGVTSLGLGRWNTYCGMLDLSAPLNSDGTVRSRWVLNYEDGDSFVDFLGNRKAVFYGVLDADLGAATLLRVGVSHQDNDPVASTWGGLPSWYADGSRTDWPRSKSIGADWTRWASTNDNQFVNLGHDLANGWQLKAQYNRFQNDAELALLYLYGAPDEVTGLGLAPSPYRSDTSREQQSIDLRVAGTFR
jgi:outer membrane receptor for ferric coprogen and ferric-rhodotorulic acid